jgi:hypothetical protein
MLDNDDDYDNDNEPPWDFCTAPLAGASPAMALGRGEHVGEGKGARRNSPALFTEEEPGKVAAAAEPMRDLPMRDL